MKEESEHAGGKCSNHSKFVVLMKRDEYNFLKRDEYNFLKSSSKVLTELSLGNE